MTIELIPVVEFKYNKDVTLPDKYANSSLYKLSDLSYSNLTKLTLDHTQEMRNGEYGREDACALFGGYILRVDGQDKYFPQCCGELSDIHYWEKIARGENSYCEGHPAPIVSFDGNKISFDFTVREFEEDFRPTPPDEILTIDKAELRKAVEIVKAELAEFQKILEQINEKENLNIENIGGRLIWENGNHGY